MSHVEPASPGVKTPEEIVQVPETTEYVGVPATVPPEAARVSVCPYVTEVVVMLRADWVP
jgi:hypothetical protein